MFKSLNVPHFITTTTISSSKNNNCILNDCRALNEWMERHSVLTDAGLLYRSHNCKSQAGHTGEKPVVPLSSDSSWAAATVQLA